MPHSRGASGGQQAASVPAQAAPPGRVGSSRAGPGGAGPGRPLPLAALGTSRRSHTAGKLFLRPGPAPADVALSVPLPRWAGVAETRAGARRCQAAGQGGGGGVRCPSGAGRGVPGITERRARGGKPCGKGRPPAPRRQSGGPGPRRTVVVKHVNKGGRGGRRPGVLYPRWVHHFIL